MTLVRNCLSELDSSFYTLMEGLRKNDLIKPVAGVPYAWEQIWSEQLQISTEERSLLTDSSSHEVVQLYGYDTGTNLNTAIPDAKAFCRQMNISYKDLIEILKNAIYQCIDVSYYLH